MPEICDDILLLPVGNYSFATLLILILYIQTCYNMVTVHHEVFSPAMILKLTCYVI